MGSSPCRPLIHDRRHHQRLVSAFANPSNRLSRVQSGVSDTIAEQSIAESKYPIPFPYNFLSSIKYKISSWEHSLTIGKSPNQRKNWFLFEIKVANILHYIDRCTGRNFDSLMHHQQEANKWHLALRHGLNNHLHINVGIPGVEEPDHPIVENESALYAALLLGKPTLRVILSGEWEVAVREGLISPAQLHAHEMALRLYLDP